MVARRIANVLTVVIGVGIIAIGARFLIQPEASAAGFGVPEWPHGTAAAYFDIKGIRDIVSGLVPLGLLITGHRRALAVALTAETVTPVGDMIVVLTHGGSAATALGIHGATAVLVALTAGLLFREHRPQVTAPAGIMDPTATALVKE